MLKKLSNILGIFLTIVGAADFTFAQSVLGLPGEDATSIGIYVKDLTADTIVFSKDENRVMTPASITKSITTAAALIELGSNYTFSTTFYLKGERDKKDKNIWNGNLIVVSSGDPTFESKEFPKKCNATDNVVKAIKDLNIKKITGNIIIEETLKDPGQAPQWEIEDTAWPYGAGLYGLNFNDNTYVLTPATGETNPKVPYLTIDINKGSSTDVIRGVNSDVVTVYGPNPTDKKWKVSTTMNNPAEVYYNYLYDKLEAAGIAIEEGDVDTSNDKIDLYTHKSPTSGEIFRNLMVNSNNLFAEGMFRAIKPKDSRADVIKYSKNKWNGLGINTDYITLKDGSGLARGNALSPIFLGQVLEYMAHSDLADKYLSYFPVAGKEGTVRRLMENTPLSGMFAIKSGSMSGVLCYAGYKIDENNKPTHVVVVMVNNYYTSSTECRKAIQNFLLDLFLPKDEIADPTDIETVIMDENETPNE